MPSRGINWKASIIALWLIFTCTLAGWWMYFSLQILDQLAAVSPEAPEYFSRHRSMLKWEGATWMILLAAGGLTLLYFVDRDRRQLDKVKAFLAAFSHDLKTSLASLRLQGESLKEDIKDSDTMPLLDRLMADTVRLEVQLENSMYLGSESNQLFIEDVNLKEIIDRLAPHWPHLKINVNQDAKLKADLRAIESVLKNLLHNSVVHGGATSAELIVSSGSDGIVQVHYSDNGKGFGGDYNQLGEIFYRHNPSSGSGLGLFIVSSLLSDMGGEISYVESAKPGFEADFILPGELL